MSDSAGDTTLATVLRSLGSDVAHVLAAPAGLNVEVSHLHVYDAAEEQVYGPGTLVLAVGVDTRSSSADRLVRAAGAGGATAVLVKVDGDPADLASIAGTAGIALVGVPTEMTWTRLHPLLTAALAGRPRRAADTGPHMVPLGDLFALADAVATVVGAAVTIEDAGGSVLAYSSLSDQPIDRIRREVILGRQIPETPAVQAVYRKLAAATGAIRVAHVEGLKMSPRLTTAIRAGGELLGSIWVIEDQAVLGPEAAAALEDAARVAALHLLRSQASADIGCRMRTQLLEAVLDGEGSVQAAAARLGLDGGRSYVVLAFEPEGYNEGPETRHERLLDTMAFHCETYRHRYACAVTAGTIYLLLAIDDTQRLDRLVGLAQGIVTTAGKSFGVELRCGIGYPVEQLHTVPTSRRQADRVLAVMAGTDMTASVAAIEDCMAQAAILELKELADGSMLLGLGPVPGIAAYDREHGTRYLSTLRAYLGTFGNVAKAAQIVCVHPNTFRYRLDRLVKLFGLDLADPDERFVVEAQLRLL